MTKLLSKKEIELIQILDIDSRTTNKEISKQLKLSPTTIADMIERLKQKNIIEDFYPLINTFAFLKQHIRLHIKCKAGTDFKTLIEYCKKNKKIGWYILFEGNWNFTCQLYTKNEIETKELLEKILSILNNKFIKYEFSYIISIEKFEHNFLYEKSLKPKRYSKIELVKLDKLDKEILYHLNKNSRAKFIDIANKLKTNYKNITYRYKKLIENKVIIANKVKLNRTNLGYDYYKIILKLNNFNNKEKNKIINYLNTDKRILFITEALGWADLEFEIFVKNQNEYREFQHNFMKLFSDYIIEYETLIPITFQWNNICME